MTIKQQLEMLQDEILLKDVCHKLRDQATQLVMGDGNTDANVVFYW